MDSNSIIELATSMQQTRLANDVQLSVLKKAIDVQSQGAMQLLEAAVQVTANPPHLGNQVDVVV